MKIKTTQGSVLCTLKSINRSSSVAFPAVFSPLLGVWRLPPPSARTLAFHPSLSVYLFIHSFIFSAVVNFPIDSRRRGQRHPPCPSSVASAWESRVQVVTARVPLPGFPHLARGRPRRPDPLAPRPSPRPAPLAPRPSPRPAPLTPRAHPTPQ